MSRGKGCMASGCVPGAFGDQEVFAEISGNKIDALFHSYFIARLI